MLETGEALGLLLAAFGLGALLPVVVQLFLAIREFRRTVRKLSEHLEPSLKLLHEMAQRPRDPEPGTSVAALFAATIPALIAAYRAFRQHPTAEESNSDSPATMNAKAQQ
jgi:hypothetical protein